MDTIKLEAKYRPTSRCMIWRALKMAVDANTLCKIERSRESILGIADEASHNASGLNAVVAHHRLMLTPAWWRRASDINLPHRLSRRRAATADACGDRDALRNFARA